MTPHKKIVAEGERQLQRSLMDALRKTQQSANVSAFLKAIEAKDLVAAHAALKLNSLQEHLSHAE